MNVTAAFNLSRKVFRSNLTAFTPCIDILSLVTAELCLDIGTVVLGTCLNAWIATSILTASELRSRMRNKILVCICAQSLFECLIMTPFDLHLTYRWGGTCGEIFTFILLTCMSEFVSNWNIVLSLVFVIYSIQGFDWASKLNRLPTTLVRYAVLMSPLILSFVLIMPIVFSFYSPKMVMLTNNVRFCVFPNRVLLTPRYALNIGVPTGLCVIFLVAAIFLKWKKERESEQCRDEMSRQLIGQTLAEEYIIPYIAFVALILLCDVGYFLIFVRFSRSSFCIMRWVLALVHFMDGIRALMFPLVMLLFPEVRYRGLRVLRLVKSVNSTDISIAYTKEV